MAMIFYTREGQVLCSQMNELYCGILSFITFADKSKLIFLKIQQQRPFPHAGISKAFDT